MVDTLIKLLEFNKSQSNLGDLKDLLQGYEDFERVCELWQTYIYLHDYKSSSYSYLSPTFCNYFGLSYHKVLQEGFASVAPLVHPDDLNILENVLFPKITHFLAGVSPSMSETTYRCSYNFRIKKKDGSYITMSVQSRILEFNSKGEIMKDFGMITPINHFIQDDKMILNISESNGQNEFTTRLQEEYHATVSSSIHLTDREIEIVKLLKEGMNSKEIADILFVSEHTIRNHRRNILKKTNTNKVTELLSLATKLGL